MDTAHSDNKVSIETIEDTISKMKQVIQKTKEYLDENKELTCSSQGRHEKD